MDLMRHDRPGQYIEGIPMRDIPLEEWEALDPTLREMAMSLGLYSRHRADAPPKATSTANLGTVADRPTGDSGATFADPPAPTVPRIPPADTPAKEG